MITRFPPGGSSVKSIQTGETNVIGGMVTDATISSVDVSKSIVIINRFGGVASYAKLKNSTTVTVFGDAAGAVIGWQVVEYV